MARTRIQTRQAGDQARLSLGGLPLADTPEDESLAEVSRRAVPARGSLASSGGLVMSPVRIEHIIQHQLDNAAPQLLLAQEPSVLPPRTHDLFASYIAATAARADWCGVFADPAGDSAGLCAQVLGAEDEFVAASQRLAERLYDQMRPRTISAGDLAVIVYRAGDDRRRVALLKLDPELRQVRSFERVQGRLRVVYDEARNTMPEERHLQKCALLQPEGARTGEVVLLDTQAGPRAVGVAAFFYRGFLGVTLAPSPRRLTRRFVELCESWLDRHRDHLAPDHILAFYAARRAALVGETVEVTRFAQDALASYPRLRGDLAEHLAANLVEADPPRRIERFTVDTAVVSRLLRVVTLELDGGARLSVRADRLASLLDMGRLRRVGNRYELVVSSLTLREVSD